jgi:hypothetical protein
VPVPKVGDNDLLIKVGAGIFRGLNTRFEMLTFMQLDFVTQSLLLSEPLPRYEVESSAVIKSGKVFTSRPLLLSLPMSLLEPLWR